MQDILSFLEKEKKKKIPSLFVAYMYTGKQRKILDLIIKISIIIYSILKGKILIVKDILPCLIRGKSYKFNLYIKLVNFIRDELKQYYCKKVFNKKNCDIILFDNPVIGEDVIFHIKSIIIQDTYSAKTFIKENSNIIDAGANIGIFSIFAAQIAKNGKVFAFEPVKETFEILRYNTKNYTNIEIFNLGLGDRKEEKEIITFTISRGISTFEDSDIAWQWMEKFKNYSKEKTLITTIDNFVKEYEIKKIDFIKIDIEGYELKILEGATETIKKFLPVISVSAYHHPEHKKKIPELILSINPNYKYKLNTVGEEDYIFWFD